LNLFFAAGKARPVDGGNNYQWIGNMQQLFTIRFMMPLNG
jgi:hypothetical protein